MLTGISSRESIMDQAENAFADANQNGSNFSLVVADIDFFKHVNDTYGHAMGDEVLKKVAGRMNNVVRGNDVIGRTGGEEFMIVLPQSDITAASAVGERIRQAIEKSPISFNDNSISITISLGAAQLKNNEKLEELIERADQALYEAKETGRNRVCLSEKTDDDH
ncbi:MAG: GGDEF domain-containing protein [Gammaproteobacteria bacterium]